MAQGWEKGGKFHKVVIDKQGDHYRMHINFTPLMEKVQQAQYALDQQVWKDVQKYMPVGDTGELKAQTAVLNAQSVGTGRVYLYPKTLPYGHYQHEGVVYVDPVYHYAAFPLYDANGVYLGLRSRFGVEKIPSERKLQYSQPNATAHWGDTAIRNHKKEWERLVYKELHK